MTWCGPMNALGANLVVCRGTRHGCAEHCPQTMCSPQITDASSSSKATLSPASNVKHLNRIDIQEGPWHAQESYVAIKDISGRQNNAANSSCQLHPKAACEPSLARRQRNPVYLFAIFGANRSFSMPRRDRTAADVRCEMVGWMLALFENYRY